MKIPLRMRRYQSRLGAQGCVSINGEIMAVSIILGLTMLERGCRGEAADEV